MKRVGKRDFYEGLVMAEALVDKDNQVLLEANTVLTCRHIELLHSWDISFVRVREPADTDESLEAQLKKDREAEEQEKAAPKSSGADGPLVRLGLTENAVYAILTGDDSVVAPGAGTLLRPVALRQYDGFSASMTSYLVGGRGQEVAYKALNEIAVQILRYVLATPGVVGYALRPSTRPVAEVARHTLAVTVWSGKIAQLLHLSAREMGNVVYGAILHDIGKASLPENVASPKRKLTKGEETLYRSHVVSGLALLKDKTWIPKEVLLILAQHHERMDGSGFPMQTAGDKIHPLSRIVGLADDIDKAMHPIRGKALSLPELAEALPFWQREHDPSLCFLIKQYLEDFILSNRVILNDGRQGEVIYHHYTFREPIIRTAEGDVLDLNREAGVQVEQYRI